MQILFGFLLAIAFTGPFGGLATWQRGVYLGTLLATLVASIFFVGPVAYHRVVFRRQLRESLVRAGNVMAIIGLGALMAAMCGAVLLVTSYVVGAAWATVITVCSVLTFGLAWWALPLWARQRAGRLPRDPGRPLVP